MRGKAMLATFSVAAFVLLGGGAVAASRFVITSTRQIKPSVLRKIETRVFVDTADGSVVTMCPAGTDTTGMCEVAESDARCPSGGFETGGGLDGGTNPPVDATIAFDEPDSDGLGWHVIMATDTTAASASFQAVAACEEVVGGTAARDARALVPESVKTQIAHEVARVRAGLR